MCEGIHFKNVQTYIQSGNVIFQYNDSDQKGLEKLITDEIKKRFGYDVTVMVLTPWELNDIVQRNPYKDDQTKDTAFIHVTFLATEPETVNMEKINSKKALGEALTLDGRAVYLYCPNGYGRTKLNSTFLENILKVKSTTRTCRTTLELLRIAENFKQ
jgi:uncharacterized protein (DUF1697 family)